MLPFVYQHIKSVIVSSSYCYRFKCYNSVHLLIQTWVLQSRVLTDTDCVVTDLSSYLYRLEFYSPCSYGYRLESKFSNLLIGTCVLQFRVLIDTDFLLKIKDLTDTDLNFSFTVLCTNLYRFVCYSPEYLLIQTWVLHNWALTYTDLRVTALVLNDTDLSATVLCNYWYRLMCLSPEYLLMQTWLLQIWVLIGTDLSSSYERT